MMVLHFIPGGKTAGQVPLRYALENLAKETKMEGVDNENELEELGRSGERISDKKPSDNDHDVMIEMTTVKIMMFRSLCLDRGVLMKMISLYLHVSWE